MMAPQIIARALPLGLITLLAALGAVLLLSGPVSEPVAEPIAQQEPEPVIPDDCFEHPRATCLSSASGPSYLTTASVDDVAIQGEGIDIEIVRRLITINGTSPFRDCYETWRRENLDAPQQGSVAMSLTFTSDYQLLEPRIISSDLDLPEVERCLLAVFNSTAEPSGDHTVQASFSVDLRPVCNDQSPR